MLFPDCEEGLECRPTGFITLPGAGNTCQQVTAKLGETCEGWNEDTSRPFPSCEEGLVCRDSGLFSIPGAENVCTEADSRCAHGEFFDNDICLCRHEIQYDRCEYPLIQDPLDGYTCWTVDEYNDLYAHTKGLDCEEGTPDDFVITRKSSPSECEVGEVWDEEDCNCYRPGRCFKLCPPGMDFDPRYMCHCEWQVNLDALSAHDLGETCGLDDSTSGGIGDSCTSNNDCLSSLQCFENVCTEFLIPSVLEGGIGDSCSTDNDCLSSLQCHENICTEYFIFGGWGQEQTPTRDDLALF